MTTCKKLAPCPEGLKAAYRAFDNAYCSGQTTTTCVYEAVLNYLAYTRHPAPGVMGEDEAVAVMLEAFNDCDGQDSEALRAAYRALAKNTQLGVTEDELRKAIESAQNENGSFKIEDVCRALAKNTPMYTKPPVSIPNEPTCIETMLKDIMKAKEALEEVAHVAGLYQDETFSDIANKALATLEKYGEKP